MTMGNHIRKALGVLTVAVGAMTFAAAPGLAEGGGAIHSFPGANSGSSSSSGFSGGGWFGWGGSSKEVVAWRGGYGPGTIVVSFADRRLYRIMPGNRAVSYSIGAPRLDARWSGTLHVSMKRVNPTWVPTPTMRRKNPKLPVMVEGGDPRNPLGVRALYLGDTMYRIHGTDAPWTIGQEVSSGCIRMHNDDVVELYNMTSIGTRVVITWKSYRGGV